MIADANSMTYVLHLKLGDDLVLQPERWPNSVRLVAALADSIFQSELLDGEIKFSAPFPEQEGYRFFLIDTPLVPFVRTVSTVTHFKEDRFRILVRCVINGRATGRTFIAWRTPYLSPSRCSAASVCVGTLGMAAVLFARVGKEKGTGPVARCRLQLLALYLWSLRKTHYYSFAGLVTERVCTAGHRAGIFSRMRNCQASRWACCCWRYNIGADCVDCCLPGQALRSPLLPALASGNKARMKDEAEFLVTLNSPVGTNIYRQRTRQNFSGAP